ncbi:MAG: PD40 domain-containing protein [Phycisphaerae bacterium]|nr:PD40 domain-containing protein [Phycisphaerae bacterium]
MRSSRWMATRWAMLALAAALPAGSCRDETPRSVVAVPRQPHVTPDYDGVVIPPNIAPLNLAIHEPGRRYHATIRSVAGGTIEIAGKTGEIEIPQGKWRDLLTRNAGKELRIEVCVKTGDGTWSRYQPLVIAIAAEPIDPYLVYRYMTPSSYFPKPMCIRQRDIESFEDTEVLDTTSFGNGCAHCHTFLNNHPDPILLGMRSVSLPSATLHGHNGRVDKIGEKFGYTTWHPSGKLVTYSVNDVRQFFHTAREEIHDVVDLDSAIFCYDVEQAQVKTAPALADKKRLETYPAWTPDGKVLYFCSAPLLWEGTPTVPPARYREVKYDLMRIGYDIESDHWGELETVLRAADTGLSILLPRVSPDGRFLMFCMAEYGCFPIYQPTSDFYLMDLQTGAYRKTTINSDYADAWHSWSSNSRWIVFSSKREGGLFTRAFISHVDADGQMGKPFILPQRSPSFYDSCYCVYNTPELVAGPVPVDNKTLLQAIVGPTQIHVDSTTGATPKAKATETYKAGQASVQ